MNLKETIFTLTNADGIPGGEFPAAEIALGELKKYTDDCYIKDGSVIAHFGKREKGKPHILLDAHIDKIGFVVTNITDDGFLKISNCGGVDRRILSAQQVAVLGKEKLPGVICSIPPHLSSKDDEIPEIEALSIDIGLSREEAEKLVSPGDGVVFDVKCALLGESEDRITGAGLDDRCGVAVILRALELLENTEPQCSFSVLFSAQEEVGERGAKKAVYDINPDIAIAVDVSFALTADDSEVKCGIMGKGPMIGVSPVLDGGLSKQFISIAKEKNIPYQIEVMSGKTSTNADTFSVHSGGVKAVVLSIPLRYMHTPVEVISLSDVENTALLIAEYLRLTVTLKN
ncbi:MAG: M20/M25/M40 family metallo-hydrolase [Oscillospiraceae bacterium]|nr:M20/M25/M40 family metallo-hydrolase [Oscillospiraceae bacterium]